MKKILAIDDQRDNLISIKGFLKNFLPNCKLFLADSGKEGIAIAQKEQPDTILLDIIMPEMDGFEVCKVLKQDDRTKFIPILMLSALGQDTESRVKGLELGADAFLAKPFIPLELKAQIIVMLRIKEAEDKLRKEKDVLEETVLERTYKLKESEEKYKALYDNAPLSYQSLDEDGFFIDVNPTWLRTLGYKVKEVIGKNYADFLHPDWRPHFEETFPEFKKRGYVHDVHFKIRHKDGSYVDIMFEGCTGTHPDGSFKQTYCVFQDITDRLHSEEKLQESEERYDLAMNATKDGIFDWNLITNEIYYSPSWKSILGYKDDELPNDFSIWEDLTEAEDVKRSWEMQTELINKKRDNFEMEFKMKHKDGYWVDILSRAEAVFNKSGKAIRIVGTHIDITERKQAEEALQESEKKFKNITERIYDVILIANLEGNINYVSSSVTRAFGYEPDELVDKSIMEMVPESEIPHVIETLTISKSGNNIDIHESQFIRKDGSIANITLSAQPVFEGNKIIGAQAIVRDITESKRAEQALKESERRTTTLINNLQGIAYRCRNDKDWTMEFVSKGIFNIAGYTPKDIIDNKKLSFNDLIIPEDRERVWNDIQSAVKKRESFEVNYRIKAASGEIKYLLEKGNGVFDGESGEFLALEGFVNDVTKSKVAAEALKSSEEMYKNVFNNSPLGILHFNKEGVITDCNDEFIGILGSTKEKLVGLNMIKQLKDKKIIKAIEDTLVNGSAYFNDYYSSVTGEKTTPVVIHFKAIYDLKDEIVGGVGMVEDITERKLAEEALKVSEELNRSITQSAADAIISMDQNGIILSWNAAAEKIFDYSSKEMTNSDLSLIIPEKYQNGHNSGVQRLKEGGKEKLIGGTIEITAIRKGGKEFPIELSLSSWETENEKYFTGIIRDITERKRAENLLSEQQQSLTGIIEGTNAGTWDWNILTGDLKLNERWSEIMGYTLEELEPIDVNTWINSVHPDDLPVANALLEKVFKKELDYYDVIFRQPHKGGGDVWVNARGKIVEWTNDGKPLRMSGIHTDITKRKKAEEEQIRSETRFKRLFDGLGDAVFVTKIGGADKGRILEVNTAALKQTGYSRDELLEMNIINDLYVAESGEISSDEWEEKLLKGEKVVTIEKKKRKDGTEFWTEMIVTQIDFKGEKASLSINHDITNRILANNALKESEEKYRELIDTTSEGFWLLNTELRTVDVNKSLCNMLGYNKEEIVGKSPLDFVDDENKIVFKNQTSKITSTLHRNYDIFFTRKNGTKFPAYLSATSIVGEDGNTTGSFAFVSDFTERKKAEENVFKFSKLFEDSLNEIYLFDVDSLKFTQVNRAGIRNLGYSLSELQQMTPIDIKPEYGEKKFKKTIEPLINGTIERLEFQTIHARKDKSTYFVEVNLQLVEFEGIRFFAAIIMDITRRKESETKIKNALEKATESERLKSAFLATISHELRTPLNAIIGFSDLINSDWPLEEIYGFAKTINESGAHLLSIVEEIFDITLIETGETTINNKDENLHLALRSVSKVIENEQRKLEKEDLELNLIIPHSDASLSINTDIAKFKQILLNLLKNALKFTHKGHINFGYSFIEHDDKKMLRFYVEDTGIGVPLDKQELIFITFRQVEESLNRTYGGTGIGLSISKKLTELLGGTLWIESEEGVGSTFYFTIPLEGVDNSRIQYDVFSETERVSHKDDIISTKTFLIVEDDDTSYEFLQIVLEKPGTNILWAKNGKEAVKLCKEIPEINLVLMDINMQVMDGYKATREIKKLRPELPIIAQTAFAIAGDREKVLKAGCDDYISKPIVIEELMKKIEKWI